MPATAPITLTNDAHINGILGNEKWAALNLTFSFPTSAFFYEGLYGDGEPSNGFAALNPAQIAAAREAFRQFSAVTNLTFKEITETSTDHAQLRLAQSSLPETALAYFPADSAEGGDAWFGTNDGDFAAPAKGNYAYVTFLHELGHSLGLDHAHEGLTVPTYRDHMQYTVMSYSSYEGASPYAGYTNETWGYAQSLMMYDIAALQHLYGANYNTQNGNSVYTWSATTGEMFINGIGQGAPGDNRILMTVWDGGGTDTYDFSSYTTAVRIDLWPGQWTTTSTSQMPKLDIDGSRVAGGNIANALLFEGDTRSLIENATGGSGDDTLLGNSMDNVLIGGLGNDWFAAGEGSNTLNGGAGWDGAYFNFNFLGTHVAYSNSALTINSNGSVDRTISVDMFVFWDRSINQSDGNMLVDDMFYYSHQPDVFHANMEAEQHFSWYGWKEGRDPNGFFDTSEYLETYADVAAAGVNPLDHYLQQGWKEGRDPSRLFDTADYLRLNPDVSAAGMNPLEHYLTYGVYEGRQIDSGTALVDDMFYFKSNVDVARSGLDAEQHFAEFGWREGRDPNAFFDTSEYLATYRDVAASGMNPLDHYHTYGWKEGRDPSKNFDTSEYLQRNPDVAAAGMNPLDHYLAYGVYEGRNYYNDGMLG